MSRSSRSSSPHVKQLLQHGQQAFHDKEYRQAILLWEKVIKHPDASSTQRQAAQRCVDLLAPKLAIATRDTETFICPADAIRTALVNAQIVPMEERFRVDLARGLVRSKQRTGQVEAKGPLREGPSGMPIDISRMRRADKRPIQLEKGLPDEAATGVFAPEDGEPRDANALPTPLPLETAPTEPELATGLPKPGEPTAASSRADEPESKSALNDDTEEELPSALRMSRESRPGSRSALPLPPPQNIARVPVEPAASAVAQGSESDPATLPEPPGAGAFDVVDHGRNSDEPVASALPWRQADPSAATPTGTSAGADTGGNGAAAALPLPPPRAEAPPSSGRLRPTYVAVRTADAEPIRVDPFADAVSAHAVPLDANANDSTVREIPSVTDADGARFAEPVLPPPISSRSASASGPRPPTRIAPSTPSPTLPATRGMTSPHAPESASVAAVKTPPPEPVDSALEVGSTPAEPVRVDAVEAVEAVEAVAFSTEAVPEADLSERPETTDLHMRGLGQAVDKLLEAAEEATAPLPETLIRRLAEGQAASPERAIAEEDVSTASELIAKLASGEPLPTLAQTAEPKPAPAVPAVASGPTPAASVVRPARAAAEKPAASQSSQSSRRTRPPVLPASAQHRPDEAQHRPSTTASPPPAALGSPAAMPLSAIAPPSDRATSARRSALANAAGIALLGVVLVAFLLPWVTLADGSTTSAAALPGEAGALLGGGAPEDAQRWANTFQWLVLVPVLALAGALGIAWRWRRGSNGAAVLFVGSLAALLGVLLVGGSLALGLVGPLDPATGRVVPVVHGLGGAVSTLQLGAWLTLLAALTGLGLALAGGGRARSESD